MFGSKGSSAQGQSFAPPIPQAPGAAPAFGSTLLAAKPASSPDGMGSTILTSGAGLTTPVNRAKKTLLGQ